ncbi:L,D-transpeptidase family protein [Pedobacter frigiditerrae]|uniref:L,D-transpeptidase family protein n=1 Tax=Pedobacter frigiditerrae TaxID=2530452 RepID=UPI00293066CD|nr:L,D-transpeptidase family protein [Pedobacter frigiditerrae]
MKTGQTISIIRIGHKLMTLAMGIFFILSFFANDDLFAQSTSISFATPDSIKIEIEKQLDNPDLLKQFNFPKTVKRFYSLNSNQANWLRPEQDIKPTVSAMLLLDCVRQFGLQPADYHNKVLNYVLMYDALNNNKLKATVKVEFELLLTDAMISMINHLHNGKYNPFLDKDSIDNGLKNEFNAEELLLKFKNSSSLMENILAVQPQIDEYSKLQGYMKLIAGQYTCDAYETPEKEIRLISMNMERLRWINTAGSTYLHVNIPTYKLYYHTADSIYEFKVVVGKPSTPTPTLKSFISHLESAPDWKVPHKIFINELLPKAIKDNSYFDNNHMAVYDQKENFISINSKTIAQIKQNPKLYHARQTAGCDNALGKVVFRFNNAYDVYLHDTPEQQYFSRSKRALSHGCVRVQKAENLAALLLEKDQQSNQITTLKTAMINYTKRQFTLKNPVPVLITYLTTTVENGLIVYHEDTYKLDNVLEKQIFGEPAQFNKVSIKK